MTPGLRPSVSLYHLSSDGLIVLRVALETVIFQEYLLPIVNFNYCRVNVKARFGLSGRNSMFFGRRLVITRCISQIIRCCVFRADCLKDMELSII